MRGILLAAACFASSLPSPGSAKPLRQAAPTASESIEISVSVAARYRLAVGRDNSGISTLTRQGPDQFCMATNGPKMALPVMLIWTSRSEGVRDRPVTDKTIQLLQCGASQRTLASVTAQGEATAGQTVIIQPE